MDDCYFAKKEGTAAPLPINQDVLKDERVEIAATIMRSFFNGFLNNIRPYKTCMLKCLISNVE